MMCIRAQVNAQQIEFFLKYLFFSNVPSGAQINFKAPAFLFFLLIWQYCLHTPHTHRNLHAVLCHKHGNS